MNTSRRFIAIIVGIIALGFAAFVYFPRSAPSPGGETAARGDKPPRPWDTKSGIDTSTPTPSAPSTNDAAAATTKSPPLPTAIAHPAPLPPVGAPLRVTFKELKARADAGDGNAACRLARDLRPCNKIAQMETSLNAITEDVARAEAGSAFEHSAITAMTNLQSTIDTSKTQCEGIDPAEYDKSWIYLLRSAQLGNSEAAIEFVADPPLDRSRITEELDAWAAYRDNARGLLNDAMARKNPKALYLMFQLNSGFPLGGGSQLGVPSNALEALATGLVVRDFATPDDAAFMDTQLAELREKLNADEQAQAEARARELAANFRVSGKIDLAIGHEFSAESCE